MFPNLRPTRREDTHLLQHWLGELLAGLSATVKGRLVPPGSDPNTVTQGSPEVLSDAALWVYTVAFEELRRQVHLQCKEKGELMQLLWQHFFNLVELRAASRYEREVQEACEQRDQLQRRLDTAHEALWAKEQAILEAERDKEGELNTERMTAKALALRVAQTQHELERQLEEAVKADRRMRDEVEKRVTVEDILKGRTRENEELRGKLQKAKEYFEQQNGVIDRLRTELAQSQEEGRRLVQENGELGKQVASLSVDLLNSREEAEGLRVAAAEARDSGAAALVEAEAAKNRAAAFQLEIQELSEQLLAAQKSFEAEAAKSRKLGDQLVLKTEELSQVNLMFARLRKDHQALNEEHDKLREDMRVKVDALDHEVLQAKTRIQAQQEEAGRLTAEIEVLQRQLYESNKDAADCHLELKQIRGAASRMLTLSERIVGQSPEIDACNRMLDREWEARRPACPPLEPGMAADLADPSLVLYAGDGSERPLPEDPDCGRTRPRELCGDHQDAPRGELGPKGPCEGGRGHAKASGRRFMVPGSLPASKFGARVCAGGRRTRSWRPRLPWSGQSQRRRPLRESETRRRRSGMTTRGSTRPATQRCGVVRGPLLDSLAPQTFPRSPPLLSRCLRSRPSSCAWTMGRVPFGSRTRRSASFAARSPTWTA